MICRRDQLSKVADDLFHWIQKKTHGKIRASQIDIYNTLYSVSDMHKLIYTSLN